MPTLTRRRSPHHRDECWHVYYRDVHAGTIAKRTGVPQAKASIVKGYDPDGVAQTEIDHFGNCPVCRTWIDMRNLGQFCAHSRRGNRGHRKCGAAARRAGAVSDDLKDVRHKLRPASRSHAVLRRWLRYRSTTESLACRKALSHHIPPERMRPSSD
jgi:hypothetical protein